MAGNGDGPERASRLAVPPADAPPDPETADTLPTPRRAEGRDLDPAGRTPPTVHIEAAYAPGSELGRGGMGRVLESEDTVLGRRVAMKVLHRDLTADPDQVRWFLEEARLTARLQHPNIPQIYTQGWLPSGQPFFTMSVISGQTLSEFVRAHSGHGREEGGLSHYTMQALRALLAASRAIAFAHDNGIVHRDIKPANIMMGPFGEVQVIDWGLAQAVPGPGTAEAVSNEREPGERGTPSGTLGFLAPELCRLDGAPHDHRRADVYSLGASLLEVLMERPPFFEDPRQSVLAAMQGTGPPELEALAARDVPEELVRICQRAMHLDPVARYPTAAEFARELEHWLDGAFAVTVHGTG